MGGGILLDEPLGREVAAYNEVDEDKTHGASHDRGRCHHFMPVDLPPRHEAVSSERRLLKGLLGGVLVPAVRLGSWRFTGTTRSD
jgi:hypothetical protein